MRRRAAYFLGQTMQPKPSLVFSCKLWPKGNSVVEATELDVSNSSEHTVLLVWCPSPQGAITVGGFAPPNPL